MLEAGIGHEGAGGTFQQSVKKVPPLCPTPSFLSSLFLVSTALSSYTRDTSKT